MIVECEHDPNALINLIGDRWFTVCDEEIDEPWRHENHPHTIRLIDCEDEIKIDVTGINPDDTRQMTKALCTLLNRHYKIK